MNAKDVYNQLKANETVSKDVLQQMQNVICKCVEIDPLPFLMRERQIQAILSFICCKNDISCFLPTGYGKTIVLLICGLYMKKFFNKRTIIVGLLKALTNEQQETFDKYARTIISDGDHRDTDFDEDWTFACVTPEKFDSMICNSDKRERILNEVGLIGVDEAHNIGDEGRGHRMENFIIMAKKTFPNMRFIYLSATVGNPEEFSAWLNTDLIFAQPSERPVPLELHVMPYIEVMSRWNEEVPDVKANYNLRMTMLRQVMVRNPNKNWLIFTTSRPRTEQIAYDLANLRNKIGLENLAEQHGIAYHNAGLTKSQREFVEESFRAGEIKIIVSTPTLAVGVNLPADCTVLFDVEQYSVLHGNIPIDSNRIQQTMGRAGRAGLSEYGYSYIFTPERLYEEIDNRARVPLQVKSQLKPRLHEKILQWFGAGIATTNEDIIEIAKFSYANISEEEIMNAINYLTVFEFVKAF